MLKLSKNVTNWADHIKYRPCDVDSWTCGRWSRYGESPRWRNVRDGGCEGDSAGLPRRNLRAVAVPGEFCVIKNRLRTNLKLCHVIPQQINKPVTVHMHFVFSLIFPRPFEYTWYNHRKYMSCFYSPDMHIVYKRCDNSLLCSIVYCHYVTVCGLVQPCCTCALLYMYLSLYSVEINIGLFFILYPVLDFG